MDLIRPLLRGALLPLQRLLVNLASAGILAIITVQMWRQGQLLAAGGQVTGFLEWPLAPLVYFMSLLCGITVLVYVVMIAEQLMYRRVPEPAGDDASETPVM